ncbi:MAG: photosystem reaction center subunit H [Leptolyngbya sp.]|uniref:Photosystem reaction center subunit H n=1 Tax=Shackletoniella antarctica TaxID=268115 RepID=A0A2W4VT43_9CYAN|nr:MAG: photosystem reaction center subunit H [Shackletoniella antarctica]PZV07251.1 MAG: photosystem reaction center subunit H [Leptolyngbya sp.]
MPLQHLKDYYPNYRETIADGQLGSIDSYSVYAQGEDKVGTAKDLLVDESGRFRYLVVDTGAWIFGKNVLLPIGVTRFDYNQSRVYVNGLSKTQVENLPEYNDDTVVDEKYEKQVRGQYKPIAQGRSNRQFLGSNYATSNDASSMNALDSDRMNSLDKDRQRTRPLAGATPDSKRQGSDLYDREPGFYGMSDEDNHSPLRLYEERLVAHRNHAKVGEVTVGKRVETETAEISEPIEKERVVIERHDVANQPAVGADHAFENQEVARMEVYEDQVNVEKEAFVREEVEVRKETDRELVRSREEIRREELDVKTDGEPRLKQ